MRSPFTEKSMNFLRKMYGCSHNNILNGKYTNYEISPITPLQYVISEGDEIFRACDRHRGETLTLGKNVAVDEHMRKLIVEFTSNLRVVVLKVFE